MIQSARHDGQTVDRELARKAEKARSGRNRPGLEALLRGVELLEAEHPELVQRRETGTEDREGERTRREDRERRGDRERGPGEAGGGFDVLFYFL